MTKPKLTIPPGVTVVSASQMDTAKRCWRLWAFQYVKGQREPAGRGAAFGNVVHERHEAYLTDSTVPDVNETWTFRRHIEDAQLPVLEAGKILETTPKAQLDKVFYPGKVMLNMMPEGIYPAPGTGEVEHHFVFKRERDLWYQGKVDWHSFDQATRHLKGIDHKTSADPQQYGLSTHGPRALRDDTQGIIYARALIDRYMPDTVEMIWSYGKSDGVAKASYTAHAIFAGSEGRGEVYAKFENDVHPIAKEIHRLKLLNAEPLSLEPSPNNCRMYGQLCSHSEECGLTSNDKIGAMLMSNENQGNGSLADRLLQGPPVNTGAVPLNPPTLATAASGAAGTPVAVPAVAGAVAPPQVVPAQTPVATVQPPVVVAPQQAAPQPPPVVAPNPVNPPEAQGPVAAVAAPAPQAPAVGVAAPAPQEGQNPLQIPPNFWQVVMQNVVNRMVEAMKEGLNKK